MRNESRPTQKAISMTTDSTFPVTNVESDSLTIDYFHLQREAGNVMGFGWNPDTWSENRVQIVDSVINAGYRKCLYPDPVDQSGRTHEWSFLSPEGELPTSSGQKDYGLPEDFERFRSDAISYADSSNNFYPPIQITSPERVREFRESTTANARPLHAAVTPLRQMGGSPQRQQLMLYPTPDATYTLTFSYHVWQRKLSSDYPYPIGGLPVSQCLMAAVLSEAERKKKGKYGDYEDEFLRRLVSAVSSDLRRGPRHLGYMGNGREVWPNGRGQARRNRQIYSGSVSVNGTLYTG